MASGEEGDAAAGSPGSSRPIPIRQTVSRGSSGSGAASPGQSAVMVAQSCPVPPGPKLASTPAPGFLRIMPELVLPPQSPGARSLSERVNGRHGVAWSMPTHSPHWSVAVWRGVMTSEKEARGRRGTHKVSFDESLVEEREGEFEVQSEDEGLIDGEDLHSSSMKPSSMKVLETIKSLTEESTLAAKVKAEDESELGDDGVTADRLRRFHLDDGNPVDDHERIIASAQNEEAGSTTLDDETFEQFEMEGLSSHDQNSTTNK